MVVAVVVAVVVVGVVVVVVVVIVVVVVGVSAVVAAAVLAAVVVVVVVVVVVCMHASASPVLMSGEGRAFRLGSSRPHHVLWLQRNYFATYAYVDLASRARRDEHVSNCPLRQCCLGLDPAVHYCHCGQRPQSSHPSRHDGLYRG